MDSGEYEELLEKIKEECIKEEHPSQAKIYRGKYIKLTLHSVSRLDELVRRTLQSAHIPCKFGSNGAGSFGWQNASNFKAG
jgi:hypothetical protein